jgi:hypothetical protein
MGMPGGCGRGVGLVMLLIVLVLAFLFASWAFFGSDTPDPIDTGSPATAPP